MTPKRSTKKFKLLYAILADANLSAASKVVATTLLLKFQNNKTGQCNPSVATIAKAVGRQRRTIFPSIEELKARQWVEVTGTKGGGRANTNQFTIKAPAKGKPRSDADDTPSGAANDTPTGDADFTGEVYGTKECRPPHTNLQEPLFPTERECVGASNDARPPHRAPDGALGMFEELCQFWDSHKPDGVDEKLAWKAYEPLADHGEEIMASAQRWMAATEPRWRKRLELWLRNGAWRNEPVLRNGTKGKNGRVNPVDEMLNAGGVRRFS